MGHATDIQGELSDIEEALERIEGIRFSLAAAIENLPDNPRITRIGEYSFSIPRSDLGGNWTAFYHDFKAQYRRLAQIMVEVRAENLLPVLRQIIDRGWYFDRTSSGSGHTLKFHPDVITHLKTLLEV
jgi:hypothetical protein